MLKALRDAPTRRVRPPVQLPGIETAECRLLLADLAIRVYQADHGEPPQGLDQLVPAYLPELPIDPYSGPRLTTRRRPKR